MTATKQTVVYRVEEQTRIPFSSLLLAYLPMLPFVFGTGIAWFENGSTGTMAVRLTVLWGGAVLAFLAGVRRGLTFRSPNGETVPQLVTMFYLFSFAIGALFTNPSEWSIGFLICGFVSVAVFDRLAAAREEVPPYFAQLRPIQMSIPVVCLTMLLFGL